MDIIDIRQVATQIVGFLLMIWILSRYAWGPLMRGLDARREKIAGEFAEADRRKAAAEDLKTRYEQELRTIDALSRQRLQESAVEGERVAAEIKAQAQSEARARLERAEDEITREREKAKEILKDHVVRLSMRTAEKILRQKIDDDAHRKLVVEFVNEVGAGR